MLNATKSLYTAVSSCVSINGLYTEWFVTSGLIGERSGSLVECLTRDREAAVSSLTNVTALWSLSKTHLF